MVSVSLADFGHFGYELGVPRPYERMIIRLYSLPSLESPWFGQTPIRRQGRLETSPPALLTPYIDNPVSSSSAGRDLCGSSARCQ